MGSAVARSGSMPTSLMAVGLEFLKAQRQGRLAFARAAQQAALGFAGLGLVTADRHARSPSWLTLQMIP